MKIISLKQSLWSMVLMLIVSIGNGVAAAPPAGMSEADWRTLRSSFSQQFKLTASDVSI